MLDEHGDTVEEADPSRPVHGARSDRGARVRATTSSSSPTTGWPGRSPRGARPRERNAKLAKRAAAGHASRTFKSALEKGESEELNLILKGDVSGSVEALEDALLKIDVGDEVALRVIDRGVGAITETNVNLAVASDAVIIGFNVRPAGQVGELADREGVDIRYYSVIYQAIEEIEAALKGMLKPEFEEVQLGTAEIREVFRSAKFGNIAGCLVRSGTIRRNAKARLIRDGVVVADNLTDRLAAPVQGRRDRGPRGLRVRYRPRSSTTSRSTTSSRRSRCARSRAPDPARIDGSRARPAVYVRAR